VGWDSIGPYLRLVVEEEHRRPSSIMGAAAAAREEENRRGRGCGLGQSGLGGSVGGKRIRRG